MILYLLNKQYSQRKSILSFYGATELAILFQRSGKPDLKMPTECENIANEIEEKSNALPDNMEDDEWSDCIYDIILEALKNHVTDSLLNQINKKYFKTPKNIDDLACENRLSVQHCLMDLERTKIKFLDELDIDDYAIMLKKYGPFAVDGSFLLLTKPTIPLDNNKLPEYYNSDAYKNIEQKREIYRINEYPNHAFHSILLIGCHKGDNGNNDIFYMDPNAPDQIYCTNLELFQKHVLKEENSKIFHQKANNINPDINTFNLPANKNWDNKDFIRVGTKRKPSSPTPLISFSILTSNPTRQNNNVSDMNPTTQTKK